EFEDNLKHTDDCKPSGFGGGVKKVSAKSGTMPHATKIDQASSDLPAGVCRKGRPFFFSAGAKRGRALLPIFDFRFSVFVYNPPPMESLPLLYTFTLSLPHTVIP